MSRVACILVLVGLVSACSGNPTEAASASITIGDTTAGSTSGTTASSESSTSVESTSTGAPDTGAPDTGAPDTGAPDTGSGSSGGGGETCHPILVEVLYDVSGNDDGDEWVKVFNPCGSVIDLSGYSLGWGGETYGYGGIDLSGSIEPDGCFLVGGPDSGNGNGNPVYDLELDLDPDLQNGGPAADGVALFDLPVADVQRATVPVDAVIYAGDDGNTNALIDATGTAPRPHVGSASSGESIGRDSLEPQWSIRATVTPTLCPRF